MKTTTVFLLLGLGSQSSALAFHTGLPRRTGLSPVTITTRRVVTSTTPESMDILNGATDTISQLLGKGIPYADLTIGVLKEAKSGERRVSQSPDSVKDLVKAGFKVVVQEGGKLVAVE